MYNPKDIQFVGKHDFDKDRVEYFEGMGYDTFSVNIFKWIPTTNPKRMKRGKCVVRLKAKRGLLKEAIQKAEEIVCALDEGQKMRKTLTLSVVTAEKTQP